MQTIHKIFLTIAVVLFLGIYFIGRPMLHKQEAVKTLTEVLTNWQKGDYTFNYVFWQDRLQIPPISQIKSYTILDKSFGHKNRSETAAFKLILNFSDNVDLPSGKNWKVEMIDTNEGWRIEKFELER